HRSGKIDRGEREPADSTFHELLQGWTREDQTRHRGHRTGHRGESTDNQPFTEHGGPDMAITGSVGAHQTEIAETTAGPGSEGGPGEEGNLDEEYGCHRGADHGRRLEDRTAFDPEPLLPTHRVHRGEKEPETEL